MFYIANVTLGVMISLKKFLLLFLIRFLGYFAMYKNIKYVTFVLLGYVYLYISYRISEEAGFFATKMASSSVGDIFFRIIPYKETGLHSLALVFIEKLKYILLLFPESVFFAVFTLATLVLVRSIFVNLTNLGIPDGSDPVISSGTFGGDLFFSGHVAFPFLLALVFWDNFILRYSFLIVSLVLGIDTVVGRYHYSIDVFATPFIVYGVYVLCVKLFSFLGINSNDFKD